MNVTKTKIYKEMIRYIKDNGLYLKFISLYNQKELYSMQDGKILLFTLYYKKIDDTPYGFYNYYFKNHEKEFITEFENFLNNNNIKEHFQENIDENFIRAYTNSTCSRKFERQPTKLLTLYGNMTPDNYIECAFLWEEAKYIKRARWADLNLKWKEIVNKIINM